MRIQVCNRLTIETRNLLYPRIVISITDPSSPEANIKDMKNIVDVLRLQFHDFDRPVSGYIQFDDTHANQIVDFIKKHKDFPDLIVHCEAGISRSAAVAAAISKYVNGNDLYFFQHYLPNAWVYGRLVRAFFLSDKTYTKDIFK